MSGIPEFKIPISYFRHGPEFCIKCKNLYKNWNLLAQSARTNPPIILLSWLSCCMIFLSQNFVVTLIKTTDWASVLNEFCFVNFLCWFNFWHAFFNFAAYIAFFLKQTSWSHCTQCYSQLSSATKYAVWDFLGTPRFNKIPRHQLLQSAANWDDMQILIQSLSSHDFSINYHTYFELTV